MSHGQHRIGSVHPAYPHGTKKRQGTTAPEKATGLTRLAARGCLSKLLAPAGTAQDVTGSIRTFSRRGSAARQPAGRSLRTVEWISPVAQLGHRQTAHQWRAQPDENPSTSEGPPQSKS